MRLLLLTTITIILSEILFSQSITFDKEFNFNIHNSVQTPDGDYIVSGYDIDRLVVARLDNAGYTKWIKYFTDIKIQNQTASLILVTGGFFISTNFFESYQVSNDSVFNKTYARLLKFDLDGNLLIDKRYSESTFDEHGYQVIEADSGKYFFLTDNYFYKIDSSGDILNNAIFEYDVRTDIRNPITRISENQYLLISYRQATCINKECDTLWTYPLSGGIFNYPVFCKSEDGNILLFVQKKIFKLNGSTGEKLFEKTLTDLNRMVTKNVIKKDNHIYLLWTPNITTYSSYITILESDTIISSEIFLSRIAEDVSFCADGFTIIGYKSKGYRLLKTDDSFNFKTVTLKKPDLSYSSYYIYSSHINDISDQFFGLQKYTLTWESNNIDYIDLDYSTDAGKNWVRIANNLSCDSSTYPPIGWDSLRFPRYEWIAPAIFSDKFLLRAIASDDQSLFDQTDPVGSIFVYQDVDAISTNQIKMWIANYGMGSHHPGTDGAGFFWPGGEDATISAIFSDGLVWGGKVNGQIRVNGCTYRYGLQPGRILENRKPQNPFSVNSKIFKLKNNWISLPEDNAKERLEFDYNNWPAEIGAPWNDVNNDGVYTKGIDTPKLIGDETLFYIANDLDTATTRYTYGSNPMGLEIQTTVFGFNREDLKDVIFKKYKFINKSNTDITDMYFTYWADDDMGFAGDDFVGCDTILNLSFAYNGDNNDEDYYGTPPPTLAHMLVQGPIVPSNIIDSARYCDGWKQGYKNLPITAFTLFLGGTLTYADPDFAVYQGTLQFYNYMQGLVWDGSNFIDPHTQLPTNFCLAGDPVTGTGWREGIGGWPGGPAPGDRRSLVSVGKFNMAPRDTQEVVYAIMMAKGTDNINSITKLRELAAHVQEFYNTELVDILNTKQTVAPTGFTLYQNYPNPFNPKTTIEYGVPEKSFVTIKIYDILGREVQTLVNNQEQVRFRYKVVFDASSLASGVYFYRVQAGNFTETKKMMVLK